MTAEVLCAIDDRPATRAVLRTARALARLWDAHVRAVHAAHGPVAGVQALAGAEGVPLEVVAGATPADVIVQGLADPEVVLGICGCRGHVLGPRPGGHTATAVASRSTTPVVLVPPDFPGYDEDRLPNVLAPLDGTERAAAAVRDVLGRLAGAGARVVVLHVFRPETVPAYLDQPQHALDAWRRAFLDRHAAGVTRMELRTGDPAADVLLVARELDTDLIVIGWHRHLDGDRGRVVRTVLSGAPVPVLLVPDDRGPVDGSFGLAGGREARHRGR